MALGKLRRDLNMIFTSLSSRWTSTLGTCSLLVMAMADRDHRAFNVVSGGGVIECRGRTWKREQSGRGHPRAPICLR